MQSNELDDGSVDGGDAASGGTSVSKKKFGRRHKLKFTSFSAAYKKGLLRDIQQVLLPLLCAFPRPFRTVVLCS